MFMSTWKIVLAATGLAAYLTLPQATVHAQVVQTIYNTTMPSVIRVAIRANNNPWGPILWVQTVGFEEYCDDVLPNEWLPSWDSETLRAGAIAVKMFAWYHSLHPVSQGGWVYDVDNTTRYQEFKYLSGMAATDKAVSDTWNVAYVPSTGEIKALDYRAGSAYSSNWWFDGTNIMSQWGSQYWGSVAKLTFPEILNVYYPGYQIRWV